MKVQHVCHVDCIVAIVMVEADCKQLVQAIDSRVHVADVLCEDLYPMLVDPT